MNLERMNRLVEVMQGVIDHEKAFSMEMWIKSTVQGTEVCGTTCCAAGYAALDPVLQEQGLEFVVFDYNKPNWPVVGVVKTVEAFNALVAQHVYGDRLEGFIRFDGRVAFDAAATFFDVTEGVANYLFNPNSYPEDERSPADVLDRIQAVIELGGSAPQGWAYHDEDEDEEDEEEDEQGQDREGYSDDQDRESYTGTDV